MKLELPTEAEITTYRNLFRSELEKNMETTHASSSPSTDAHRVALRSFVEGRNKIKTAHGVLEDNLSRRWMILPDALLAIQVDTHVGERVKKYLDAVDVVLEMTDEKEEQKAIMQAAANVCSVWYFG